MRSGHRPTLHLMLMSCATVLPGRVAAEYVGSAENLILRNPQMMKDLRVSAGANSDTVYVAKSATNFTAADNYWNIHTGTHFPGVNLGTNASWDWDNTVGIRAADSL